MSKYVMIFLAVVASISIGKAADLVVQDNGPVGTFSSIGAAVTAAADGDRILINNTLTGLAWNENITIDKSLTLASAVDNQQFLVLGNYTIVHAPGREVNIIGMDNSDGSISGNGAGNTSRTIVNIMWCSLNDGDINLNYDYFELNMASSEMSSYNYVRFCYGSIIGNDMNGTRIELYDEGPSSEDTIQIVGNKDTKGVYSTTNSYYVNISNNYINQSTSSSSEYHGVRINMSKSGNGVNTIKNNSMRIFYGYGILISSTTSGTINVYNNVIYDAGQADYGIRNQSSNTYTVSYNFIDNSFDNERLDGVINDGTNVIHAGVVVGSAGTNSYAPTIDGGSPGLADYDLDLTRNDAGCYGGSYTLDNFHPISGNSSKVYFLQMPDEVIIGGTNEVSGFSFDR